MIPADFCFHTNPNLDKAARQLIGRAWGEKWAEAVNLSPIGTRGRGQASFGSDTVSWGTEKRLMMSLFFVKFGTSEYERNDPTPSTPAVSIFYWFGSLHSYIHYANGAMSDVDGIPGKIVFWENGAVRTVEHYRNGVLANPENGAPAIIHYDSKGEIVSGRKVRDNGTINKDVLLGIGREETYNLLQKGRNHDIYRLSNETPVIMAKGGDRKGNTNANQRWL